MTHQRSPLKDNFVYLSEYLLKLWHHKTFSGVVFVAVVVIIVVADSLVEPVYRATAQVEIKMEPSLLDPLGVGPEGGIAKTAYFKTQLNLLLNRSLVHEVVEQLDLVALFRTRSSMDERYRLIIRESENSNLSEGAILDRITEWYVDHLVVAPVAETNLVNISFLSFDPDLATCIVNAHVQAAIDRGIRHQDEKRHEAFDWFARQVDHFKMRLEASQREIHAFLKEAEMFSVERIEERTLQEISRFTAALNRLQHDRIEQESIYHQIRSLAGKPQAIANVAEIADDPTIKDLRLRYDTLKKRVVRISSKYGVRHPVSQAADSEKEAVVAQLESEIERKSQAIAQHLDRLAMIRQEILKALRKSEAALSEVNARKVEYEILKSRVKVHSDIYDFLVKNTNLIILAGTFRISNIQVVSLASTPSTAYRLGPGLSFLLSLFIGGFASVWLTLVLDHVRDTINMPEDIPLKLGLPALGQIDRDIRKGRKTSAQRKSVSNDDFYPRIRNPIPPSLYIPDKPGSGRVVALQCADGSAANALLAHPIAASMARTGLNVLLIDCRFHPLSEPAGSMYSNSSGLLQAMRTIATMGIKSGSLDAMSTGDLLFIIQQKKATGKLFVSGDSGHSMTLLFEEGKLIHLQNDTATAFRLGTLLLRKNLISSEMLTEALARSKAGRQRLGYCLVNGGYTTQKDLRSVFADQIESSIEMLFSIESGRFEFLHGAVESDGRTIPMDDLYDGIVDTHRQFHASRIIKKELHSKIVVSAIDHLWLMRAESAADGSDHLQDYLNTTISQRFLDHLRRSYDVIVLNSIPLTADAGGDMISGLADAIAVVVMAKHRSAKVLRAAVTMLPQDKIIGVILNHPQNRLSQFRF